LIAERSFHSVEIDEPEIVISGIRQVVKAVRARAAIAIPPSPIGLTAR
jgi:hypothetical protein